MHRDDLLSGRQSSIPSDPSETTATPSGARAFRKKSRLAA
jgi:hypothetical protein